MNNPEHTHDHHNDGLPDELFIVAAHHAVTTLGWETFYISPQGIVAFAAPNEEVRIVKNGPNVNISANGPDTETSQKNINILKDAFEHALATNGPEAAHTQYEVLSKSFRQADNSPLSGDKGLLQTLGDLFIPVKNFFFTPLLLITNILVFIIMVASGVHFFEPDAQSVLEWGANFQPVTLNGEWWRMFTACFLHFGILHLVLNMYALGFIGLMLEPLIGKWRYITAYLLTGVAASAASLYFNDAVVSAGASGAIFGMYGMFLAMLAGGVVHKSVQKDLFASIGIFVAYSLFSGFTATGIDNAAHLGGLISGFIIGMVMVPGIKKPQSAGLNFLGFVGAIIIGIGTGWYAYNYASNDLAKFQELEQQFVDNDQAISNIYVGLKSSQSDEAAANIVSAKILPTLNKNLVINNQIKQLDLPETLDKRITLLGQYTNLKIKYFTFIEKAMRENTGAYDTAIQNLDSEIEAALNEINGVNENNQPKPTP